MTKTQKQQRKTVKELNLLIFVNIKGNENTDRNESYTHTHKPELLKVKNTLSEVKNSVNRINHRLDIRKDH